MYKCRQLFNDEITGELPIGELIKQYSSGAAEPMEADDDRASSECFNLLYV